MAENDKHEDSLSTLLSLGMPLEDIKGYMADGLPLDEILSAARSLIAEGRPIADPEPDLMENTIPALSTVTAADLQKKDIPPVRWIVQDLIPAGLTILASPPKFGKSWMAMSLCLSVAMGGNFLGYQCNKCGCLYCALEDGKRRLKSRMGKIIGSTPAPPGFSFTTTTPTLGNGLVDALEGYIRQNPTTGLIVVDTFQKVRDMGGKDVYGRDYADVGTLKKFADAHNIAVVLIHHLRKMGDDSDPFARISGSNGISGAADSMMVLAKEKQSEDTATLSITGRDVEMQELVLRFSKSSCLWENLGDADAFAEQQACQAYTGSPIACTIRKLLEQSPEGWTGTAQQLLDAGTYITRTRLAPTARDLSAKLKQMSNLFFEYDNIIYERKGNGTGGGKHTFHYPQQFEELPQSEITPFPLG